MSSDNQPENVPDLEDALDGLQAAERYCSNKGLDDLARRAAALYQAVGKHAPEDDWDDPAEDMLPDEAAVLLEPGQARGMLVPDDIPPEKREEVAKELERRVQEHRKDIESGLLDDEFITDVTEFLAEETGRDASDFDLTEDMEFPHPDELDETDE